MSDEEIVLKRLKETLDVLKGKNVIGRIDFQIRDMVEDCIRIIEKQKEKNKKAIDFINDKNNYFEDGENWQNILKIKDILEE